jgi:hypothetical protein
MVEYWRAVQRRLDLTLDALQAAGAPCVYRLITERGGWRQVYHSIWLDDADQLARY